MKEILTDKYETEREDEEKMSSLEKWQFGIYDGKPNRKSKDELNYYV